MTRTDDVCIRLCLTEGGRRVGDYRIHSKEWRDCKVLASVILLSFLQTLLHEILWDKSYTKYFEKEWIHLSSNVLIEYQTKIIKKWTTAEKNTVQINVFGQHCCDRLHCTAWYVSWLTMNLTPLQQQFAEEFSFKYWNVFLHMSRVLSHSLLPIHHR